jgi:hypothetical protein
MTQQNLGERVAKLEADNESSKPLHVEFSQDISVLKTDVAEIKFHVKNWAKNGNGGRSKIRELFPYGSSVGFLGALAAVLKFLG